MQERELKELLKRIRNGKATNEEKAFLENWYLQYPDENSVEYSLDERVEDAAAIWVKLKAKAYPHERRLWPRIAAAASVLLVLSFGAYFALHKNATHANTDIAKNNIVPGGNQAVLYLANGKKIILTVAKNGTLASQNNTAINKTSAGHIVYNASSLSNEVSNTFYDTLTTPRGGIWHITLADGSVVWLNAATSIRYPENFIGKERVVELLDGEAYFEVKHNAAKPFKVSVAGQMVEDIGTHFNINAYKDEPHTKITLLEGSIKLINGNESATLKPGQEAILKNNRILITKADVDQTIAWKNGLISFDNTDVKSLMRQLSRWYDIQVIYQGTITDHEFAGDIRRNTDLSNVLKIMEQGGVHFKIEGHKLIVIQ